MTTKLAENIYRIRIDFTNSPLKNLNTYYIKSTDGGRDLIIDAGFPNDECLRQEMDGLLPLGYDKENTDFLCTHLHGDHSGLSVFLTGSEGKIYISKTDYDFAKMLRKNSEPYEIMREYYSREGLPKEVTDEFIARRMRHQEDFSDARFTPIPDGTVLSYGGHELKLLEMPGHSPGNSMIFMEKEGIMFTGDHILFDISPNISSTPFMEDALGQFIESLNRSKEYTPALSCPAHRDPGDYQGRILELKEHHKDRLCECLSILTREPGINAYEVTKRLTWHIRYKTWDDFPKSQLYFAMSESMAHLDFLRFRGIIRRDENYRYYPVGTEEDIRHSY